MFKTRRQAALIRLAEIEKAFNETTARMNAMIIESEKLQRRAFLVDIQREGKLNKFFFMRNGEVSVIETYGTLSDDVDAWRKGLIE